MKATLCLLADFDAENFCREYMVEASMKNNVGVAAANLPRHISLGLPYEVKVWKGYLDFAERLAKKLNPVTVSLSDMVAAPIAGVTGSFFFRFEEDFGLDQLRAEVTSELKAELGIDVPENCNVSGQRNITLGFGSAPYESYKDYVGSISKEIFLGKKLTFDQLGVFYYDSDKITATSFMCCRRFFLG